MPLGWLVSSFLGSSIRLQLTPLNGFLERIFTQNASKDVVPGKEVPFWGHDDYILFLDPYIPEKLPFWVPILTGLGFFAAENLFNLGILKYKLPLIVIVVP